MKFFLPFWWDHVYTDFNPWKDSWTSDSNHFKFLWELGDRIPFDGILFSRIKVEESKKKFMKIIESGGLRNYLRIPNDIELFGDCGAYGYINEEIPPYDPIETLEFYKHMRYDLACTVDHLIVKSTEDQKYERFELTLKNSEIMINKWSSDNYSFDLIGVAQGWDRESYYESVKSLIDMNFNYIAFGGLVRTSTPKIVEILRACHRLWKNREVRIHLFGLARWNIFPLLRRFRITSFDNAYHRRAWMSGTNNYELGEKAYTALRVPFTNSRIKSRIIEEQNVFDVFKSYDSDEATSQDVINILKIYEEKLVELGKEKVNRFARLKGLENRYLDTLQDKPWLNCDCSMCTTYGLHVCIFRSNERNMRRGFHNLTNFYSRLNKWLNGELTISSKFLKPKLVEKIPLIDLKQKKVLIITSCTSKKLGNTIKIKAKANEMYTGRMFINSKILAKKMNWDYVIISAKYGLLYPDDIIESYDKYLKNKKDIENIKEEVQNKLSYILPNYDKILVLAGKKYQEVIRNLMDDRFILIKSKGYGDFCSIIKSASQTQEHMNNYFDTN